MSRTRPRRPLRRLGFLTKRARTPRHRCFIGLVCVAGRGLFAAEVEHPRLFVTTQRAKEIRKQVQVDGSHHQLALAELKARVNNPDLGAAYGSSGGYVPGYRAVEAAFLSVIADNDAGRKRYADLSYEALAAWTKTGSATLGKSMEARCLALACDWAYPAWTDQQRAAMRKRVDAVLAALGKISHSNLGGDRTSNFVGVIRGAELLLQLAAGADVKDERVDEKYTYKDATERMGKVVAFEPSQTGGYGIVQGGQMYEKLGVGEAVRHMRVDFLADNQAIVSTLDRVKTAGGEHAYTWQANVGDGVKVEAGEEAERPFFLMKGSNETFLKGWVLDPAAPEVTAGDPLRITARGTDAEIRGVMFVGQGNPPSAVVAGQGSDSLLSVAGRKVSFDGKSGRILLE